MTQKESLQQTKPLNERVLDPRVSLGELLTEAGFEGLTPEARLGMIERATLDGYKAAAAAVHYKVAPEHSHEVDPDVMNIIDPRTGKVIRHTAAPADRDGLLVKALENAKLVAEKYRTEGDSLECALQRCGNLAAFGLVLAHTYGDGNGRTARTIGELVHIGYDSTNAESVSDLATISVRRPDAGFRINSYVPTGEWAAQADVRPLDFLDVVAALDVPLDGGSYAASVRGSFTTPRM